MSAVSQAQRESIPYIVLAVAVFITYANVYGNDFLLDDMVLIVQNKLLHHWNDLPELLSSLSLHGTGLPGGFYRPLQELWFFFLYQIFGISPVAFHAANVLLQALATGLVYRLGRALGWQKSAAFAAALIWGICPLHTESIDYASGSADPLYTILCLAGILVLLPDFALRRFWAAGLLFVLALGAKESAIVFPALAVFTLFLVSKERLKLSTYIRTWPLWVIAAAYIVSLHFLSPEQSGLAMHDPSDTQYTALYSDNIINRILTSLSTLPVYLKLMFWPADLHMERVSYPVFSDFSWQVLAGLALVAAALLQIIWGKGRRGLACTWGLLWFAAAFSPYTGIVEPINAFVAEHWLYLPGIGLALGFSQTIAVWLEQQKIDNLHKIAAGLVVLAAVGYGSVTFIQNRVWHDPVAFYEHIFDCGEESGRAHSSLGQYYFTIGEYEKSKDEFLKSVAHPAPLFLSQTTIIHMHLGFIYLGARPNARGLIAEPEVASVLRLTPHLEEAREEFEKVVAIDPNSYWAHKFLAMIYDYKGERDKAALHNGEALRILRSGQNPDKLL